ncbi:hypothetical protein RF11_02307 [Thelohanellus kitauei]|uniref:Tc1-like transposase DDE domain-containing protein n=1 Tax=Thelohanellus kitauei TaxID=669202 RepID=A0A0C2JKS9_THEKT|nr:hypothetical protein RF11_02307 [Thelohanellus kitauei]
MAQSKKLTQEQNDYILDLVDEDCSITLKELKIKLHERFGIQVCITTISKSLGDFLYSFKRVHMIPKRRNGVQTINSRFDIDESKIIFMDETGFNISMRSIYGRSPRNTQPTKMAKSIRCKNINRAYNRENSGSFLSNSFSKLADMNFTHCTFIMDNVPFHKCEIFGSVPHAIFTISKSGRGGI